MNKSGYKCGKNPLTVFIEYCEKSGTTPQYNRVPLKGKYGQPHYECTCKVGAFTGKGKSGNQDQAKLKAAEKVLQAMSDYLLNTNVEVDSSIKLQVSVFVLKMLISCSHF